MRDFVGDTIRQKLEINHMKITESQTRRDNNDNLFYILNHLFSKDQRPEIFLCVLAVRKSTACLKEKLQHALTCLQFAFPEETVQLLAWNDYKISELLGALSLVDRCVQKRVCKQDYDVLDSRVFWRITFSMFIQPRQNTPGQP